MYFVWDTVLIILLTKSWRNSLSDERICFQLCAICTGVTRSVIRGGVEENTLQFHNADHVLVLMNHIHTQPYLISVQFRCQKKNHFTQISKFIFVTFICITYQCFIMFFQTTGKPIKITGNADICHNDI